MSNVLIRPWVKEDARQLAFIANNINIWNNLRDQLPHPYNISHALQWIHHCNTQFPLMNFAVTANDIIVGSVGATQKQDVYCKTIEIGYFIGEIYWGNGIATEAVKQLVAYIEQELQPAKVTAEVFGHNKSSMNVLRKNGFYLECIERKAAFKNNRLIDTYNWVKLIHNT